MPDAIAPPAAYADLLSRPLFAHLATVRPDGQPMSSVMWFLFEDGVIKMTHTKSRQKFRNLTHEPRVALSISDPEDPYRYLEVRGFVHEMADDDAEASFYRRLQERYDDSGAIPGVHERVIVSIVPTRFVAITGGAVVTDGAA